MSDNELIRELKKLLDRMGIVCFSVNSGIAQEYLNDPDGYDPDKHFGLTPLREDYEE